MKSKFVKSTLILVIGGMFTKLLGMLIKIVMTRLLGTEGIGIYMLIMPTFSLFISFFSPTHLLVHLLSFLLEWLFPLFLILLEQYR